MGRIKLGLVGLWLFGCVSPPARSPCDAVECLHGTCVVAGGAAACLCDSGFALGGDGASCEEIDLCSSNPCAALTGALCLQRDRDVSCECPPGSVALEGACVFQGPCTPNPCTAQRRTTCELEGGVAVCRCEPGYAPEGNGCAPTPLWSCDAQHAGSAGEDAAEPDECPPLAATLTPGEMVNRTLQPTADHDWFQVQAAGGQIFSLDALGTIPLLVDVFDAAGVQLLAADGRGLESASVAFVIELGGPVMVRVRALEATRTGEYTLALTALGPDDHSAAPAESVAIAPGGTFEGSVQFAGDVDAVWFDVPGQVGVKLESVRLPTGAMVVLELQRSDGTSRVLHQGESVVFTTPTDERLRLVARGSPSRQVGAFKLVTTDVGPDDASDDPLFATPLVADGNSRAGLLEHPLDVDAYALQAIAGRVYRARWQSLSGTSLAAVSIAETSGALVAASRPGLTHLSWKAPASGVLHVLVRDARVGSQPGGYAISIDDLGVDDYGDTNASATPVSFQLPVEGRIDFAADVDVFSITPNAGRLLRVTVAGQGATASVLDPAGTESPWLPVSTLPVTMSGTHYVRVRAANDDPVAYSVTVADLGADDHGDTMATATPTTIGTWMNGEIQFSTDLDFFSFSPLVGHVYRLDCGLPATRCTALNPSGAPVTGTWINENPRFLATSSGTWFARLGTLLGPYTLRVDDVGPEDHGETNATATAIPDGGVVTGEIGFEQDLDVFSFDATAGRIYVATLQSQSGLRLQHHTSTGAVDERSSGDSLSFVTPTSGRTWLSVFNGSLAGVRPYTLTLTEAGLDDHGNEASTATALTLGGTTTGTLEYQGDVDVFRVPIVAGHHHRVRAVSGLDVVSLRVETGSGSVVASLDYEGNSVELTFRAPAQVSEVFVRVSTSSPPSTYSLLTEDLGPDDFPNDLPSATPLTFGVPVSGVLEVDTDVDAFSLAVTNGQLIATSCATALNPGCLVQVRNPAGAELLRGYSAFRVTQDGVYTLEVSGSAGPWVLTTGPGTDDHGNDRATATPLTLGTRVTGTNEYFNDTDMFAFTVTAGTQVFIEPQAECITALRGPNNNIVLQLGDSIESALLVDAGQYLVSVRNCPGGYSLLVGQ